MSQEPHEAVAALVERDGKILCVFNRRYNGWACPGGRVEDGETVGEALRRELFEETGLVAEHAHFLQTVEIPAELRKPGRGTVVHLWRVTCEGTPEPRETAVAWLTIEVFLGVSPFRSIYEPVFRKEPSLVRSWRLHAVRPDEDRHALLAAHAEGEQAILKAVGAMLECAAEIDVIEKAIADYRFAAVEHEKALRAIVDYSGYSVTKTLGDILKDCASESLAKAKAHRG